MGAVATDHHRRPTSKAAGAASPTVTDHRWQGSALLRPGVMGFRGSIGATDLHSHHAVQILTATTPLTVTGEGGARHRGTTLIVSADAEHRIEAGAERGWLIFLEPESTAGRTAHHRSIDRGWTADLGLGHPLNRPLAAVVVDLMAQLMCGPNADVPERHPAVLEALHLLPELTRQGAVRGTEVAAKLGVSVSRLTHLFTAQVGIPLRRYVLWLRLRIAIASVQAGTDLTDAAYSAGFADSAHLTRTCREMFGLPPSALSRHVSWDIDGI